MNRRCQAMTLKGRPCRNRALPSERFCALHKALRSAPGDQALWAEPPVEVGRFVDEHMNRRYFPRQMKFLEAAAGPAQGWDSGYREFVLMWGMGSGKDYTAQALVAYTIYKLMCMKDPCAFFGVESIDIVNVSAVNELQAGEVFFRGLKKSVAGTADPESGGNWFEARGMDLRARFGDLKSRIVRFPKGITARCFGSKETAPEGLNILLGIMDEPSRAARSRTEYLRAKAMFRLLKTNAASRFGACGKTVLISYPQARIWDLTVERYEAGRERADVYADRASTPEVNLRVRDEDFAKEREEDPDDLAVRVYCRIPEAVNPLIPDPARLESCLAGEPRARVLKAERRGPGGGFTALEIEELRGDRTRPYYLHVDYGLNRASTAVVLGHGEPLDSDPGARLAVIDLILEWRPRTESGRTAPVDFLNVDATVRRLCAEFWVAGVTADRWNSEHLLQQLGALGVPVRSVAYTMPQQVGEARVLKRLIENGLVRLFRHERAVRQLLEMRLEGERLVPGPDAGKDIFDGIARVVNEIHAETQCAPMDTVIPEEEFEDPFTDPVGHGEF